MAKVHKTVLKEALDALARLMKIFQAERILYLIVSFVSFLILLFATIKLFTEHDVSEGTMTAVLGGSGLATIASSRVSYFLNKSFRIIEDIIRKVDDLDEPAADDEGKR